MEKVYKIKEGYMLREVAGNFVVVAVGKASKEFKGIINLNEMGAFIFEKLINGATIDCIVKDILNEYEVEEAKAKEDVTSYINILVEKGIAKEE